MELYLLRNLFAISNDLSPLLSAALLENKATDEKSCIDRKEIHHPIVDTKQIPSDTESQELIQKKGLMNTTLSFLDTERQLDFEISEIEAAIASAMQSNAELKKITQHRQKVVAKSKENSKTFNFVNGRVAPKLVEKVLLRLPPARARPGRRAHDYVHVRHHRQPQRCHALP